MAYTVSQLCATVFGDKRVVFLQVTADAAEGTVSTGLPNIAMGFVNERKRATFTASGNTAQSYMNYVLNAGSTGTVIAGTIGFSGCVNGNIYHATVFGPS